MKEKFKNFIKKRRNIILLVLVAVSIYSIFYIGSFLRSPEKPNSSSTDNTKFEFVKVIPNDGTTSLFPNTSAIEFVFSKPIDISSLIILTDPKVEISIETDNNDKSLFIRPKKEWVYGQKYTLNINVKSKDKEDLSEKIITTFTSNIPKVSPMDEVPTGK